MDIQKQIEYWRSGASEDWQVAVHLVNAGRTRHGLFFAQLALEKMLNALVCRATNDLAPRIHTLLRLAERAGLEISEQQRLFLARFDRYQLEGRYPDVSSPAPDVETAREELKRAQEMYEWLSQQLSES
jgi:HEPN domain-containing protein